MKIHIEEYKKNITEEDIELAIRTFLEWQRTGNWNNTGTKIHEIHETYFKPLGVGETEGLLEAYSIITGELAKRWLFKRLAS